MLELTILVKWSKVIGKYFSIWAALVTYYLLPFPLNAAAQSQSSELIQVVVSLDKPDWTYKLGEQAKFRVKVLKHQRPMENIEITYTIGLEKMHPMQYGKAILNIDSDEVGEAVTLSDPGFVRCEVRVRSESKEYRGIATAAFTPELIKPTQLLPDDFWEFWDNAKIAAAKIPIDPHLVLIPERCTEKTDVYHVSIQNFQTGSRIYGILAKPRTPGKYPAVLDVPGAGVLPYPGIVDLAEMGIITLQIGIHGIPVTYEANLYKDLGAAALRNYQFFNLDDRDNYYYKRVYISCLRAIDYLFTLPEFDGSELAVCGGSQGGALSIVTAALDSRVKYLVSLYPALCDLTGYLHGRAGGWPHMFNETNAPFLAKEEKINVSAYYDVVNFARAVNVPGFYTWGYNDDVCPPTSYYAAYNQISAPKELYLAKETGHWLFQEQEARMLEWLLQKLKP